MATSRTTPDVLCACIDIGSTTTRLLVAEASEAGLREVLSRRAFTQLGRGLAPGGAVPPARLEAVAAAVAEQAEAARAIGTERLRAVATAPLRRARNAAELGAAIRVRAGVEVETLSPEDEARLAFRGATGTTPVPGPGPVAVVDVGGGSTEIVVGAGAVSWSASIGVGTEDLTAAHVAGDPPTHAELARLGEEARRALAGLRVPVPRHALAVGGSASSLRRLVGSEFTPTGLAHALALLASAPAAHIAAAHDLDPRRVRLLPAGLALLEAAGELVGCAPRVANGGLREGVLLEAWSVSADPGRIRSLGSSP